MAQSNVYTVDPMKTNELDLLLDHLAARPLSAPPSNLVANVWREIRLRRDSAISPLEALADWFWRRQIAFASVPMAMVMGMVMALTWTQHARSDVSRALYLDVFSQRSPTLPSTYITSGR